MWNYYRDKVNDDANENNDDDFRINNNETTTSKSFEYKAKMIRNITADNSRLDAEVVIPLKYFVIFEDFLVFL